jgi:hypothetical protein
VGDDKTLKPAAAYAFTKRHFLFHEIVPDAENIHIQIGRYISLTLVQ